MTELGPLSEAEEKLLRGLLVSGLNHWSEPERVWLARLLATIDELRADPEGLREALDALDADDWESIHLTLRSFPTWFPEVADKVATIRETP